MPISVENFITKCSDIVLNRAAAIPLLSHYAYVVYLDLDNGYPQVKIVASKASDYEPMDALLENAFDIVSNSQVFTIHDNYSHYNEYNDFTYTIPITHANFKLLQVLFDGKDGFRHIERSYMELQQRFRIGFKQHYQSSSGYLTYQLLQDYGSWTSATHLYNQPDRLGLHHIEKLRGLQKSTLSDPWTPIFVQDDDEPILNDILTIDALQDIIDPQVIKNYLDRYYLEMSYNQVKENKQAAIETLSSMGDVLLCGVLVERFDVTIFGSYVMRVVQCLNEIYKTQKNSRAFQSLIQSDADIKELSLPTQTQLLALMGSNYRWVIDGSERIQGQADPNHRAWQCGVYYKAIDANISQLLLTSGFEHLSKHEYANVLACIPYDTFKLLVLCFNLQITTDIDLKEIYASICETMIKERLAKELPIPEVVIEELHKLHRNAGLVEQSQRLNQIYYQRVIQPMIMQELLENAQNCIRNWQKEQSESDHIVDTGLLTFAFDKETNKFAPIVIPRFGEEDLLKTILALKNPHDFTLQLTLKLKMELGAQMSNTF